MKKEEESYTHLYASKVLTNCRNNIKKNYLSTAVFLNKNWVRMYMQVAPYNRNLRQMIEGQQLAQQQQLEEEEVYVLFVNTTNRTVDLYWERERDTENIQYTLKPYEEVRVNTYNTHIWFFRDYYTGERMHVRSKRIFCPVRIRVPRDPQRPHELSDVRSQVLIHFPLRTLKDNCLWLIVKWLKRTSTAPRDYINGYMIPATLKQHMLLVLSTIEAYCIQAHSARNRR